MAVAAAENKKVSSFDEGRGACVPLHKIKYTTMSWKIIQNNNPYKEYSVFEYLWVDIFLNKGLLRREDLVKILKHFEINFVEKN